VARRISSPVLIGREAEMRACELTLQEAADGRPGLILLGGEAGIGKSRLASEFAAMAVEAGGYAAIGSAAPPSGVERVPLAAIAGALRSLLRAVDARLIETLLGPARGDLAALLPELGEISPADADRNPFAAARLAESVLVAVESVASRRGPLLLVLEDLHWADDATRATVMHLARSIVAAPVVMVVTYRSDGDQSGEGFLDFLAEVGRADGSEWLDLDPLDLEQVAEQVRSILGSTPAPELVRAIVRRSGGIPFFVEELLLETVSGSAERPPPSVRAAVEARISRLSVPARELVGALAMAAAEVPVDLLGAVADLDPSSLAAALDELRVAYLIKSGEPPGEAGTGRVGVRHVLVGEAIVEAVSLPRRQQLHARYAAVLERDPRLGGVTEVERASRLASHLLLAGETARAIPALLREAAAAEETHAFDAAAGAYAGALSAWGMVESDALDSALDRAAVLERGANSASLSGRPNDAMEWAVEALGLARDDDTPGDTERIARLTMHLGRFQAEAGQGDAAVATLVDAVAASDSASLLHARCVALLARLLLTAGRPADALAQAEIAVGAAIQLDAPAEAAQARSTQAAALAALGRMDEALSVLAAGAGEDDRPDMARTMPSRPSRLIADLHGHLYRADVLEQAGDLAAAAAAAQACLAEAQRRGLAATHGAILAAVAGRDLLQLGDWAEVERVLDTAAPSGAVVPPEATLVRAHLAALRGDWTDVEHGLASAGPHPSMQLERGWASYPYLVIAEMSCWRRRFLEARDAVRRGVDVAAGEGEDAILLSLAAAGVRIESEAASAGPRKRGVAASAAAEITLGYWVRISTAAAVESPTRLQPRQAAAFETARAELERFEGRSSAESWRRALDAWRSAGDPYEAARAELRQAEALLAGDGDRDAARDVLRDAMDLADGLGARPLAREAERLARRARLAGVSAREASPPMHDVAAAGEARARELGLSARETEVLMLIAEGLTDREIGERLFITTKTAGHHVSHILTKLAVDRRGEAAAVAFRIGLVEGSV